MNTDSNKNKKTMAMYDRYMLSEGAEDLAAWFEATLKGVQTIEPNYNAAPSDIMPVIHQDEIGRRIINHFSWGLLPYWATEEETTHNTVHARAETLADQSTFRPYFMNRRCLVPAGGFYLWKQEGEAGMPYLIRPAIDTVFALAGLYGVWESPAGERKATYCIITTAANEKIKTFDDRMPAILPKEVWAHWLDPSNRNMDALRKLLGPCPADVLEYCQVSEDVNYLHTIDPRLIRPVQWGKNKLVNIQY